jgi:hypothetical protein
MKYILIYLLNLADYATTVYWTNLHGIQTETNPLMRMALTEPWLFAIIKLVLFPLLLLYMHRKKHDDTAWMALGMFIVVVLMNLRVIFGW